MKDIALVIIGAILGVIADLLFRQKLLELNLKAKRFIFRRFYKTDPFSGKPSQLRFGNTITGWISLYGTGEHAIENSLLRAELDEQPIELPSDLRRLRDYTKATLQKKVSEGHSNIWNAQRFSLREFEPTRLGSIERLGLWFRFQLTDYAAYYAITSQLDKPVVFDMAGNLCTIRDKYFPMFDVERPNPYITHSFSIDLVVVTKQDNKVILVKRNNLVARSKNKFTVSVQEGMQYPLDLDEHGRPSFVKTAVRGLWEELGIDLDRINVTSSKIEFLNFGVLANISEYALLGCIKLPIRAYDVEQAYYDLAKDRGLETTNELYAVDFYPAPILEFIANHAPWTHHGIANLFYTMVRYWGYWEVKRTIKKFNRDEIVVFDERALELTGK